eukprot:scaffold155753_cov37-Tisochrysis_lutea.AAC.4
MDGLTAFVPSTNADLTNCAHAPPILRRTYSRSFARWSPCASHLFFADLATLAGPSQMSNLMGLSSQLRPPYCGRSWRGSLRLSHDD